MRTSTGSHACLAPKKVTAVGFEPTPLSRTQLECVALDHSAKLSLLNHTVATRYFIGTAAQTFPRPEQDEDEEGEREPEQEEEEEQEQEEQEEEEHLSLTPLVLLSHFRAKKNHHRREKEGGLAAASLPLLPLPHGHCRARDCPAG